MPREVEYEVEYNVVKDTVTHITDRTLVDK